MTEIRIKSWTHLCDEIFKNGLKRPTNRFRSPEVYRGLSQARHKLIPKLNRWAPLHGVRMENLLIHNFKTYSQQDPLNAKSIWMWLALAQHHGLPTRLLDWTYSPLVAAHFATANTAKYDKDGVIWCVNVAACGSRLPRAAAEKLQKDGIHVFTVEMLSYGIPDLDTFRGMTGPKPLALFFEPPSLDQRIAAQHALFSVMSDAAASMEDWLNEDPTCYRKIILPAKLKWEIRDKLDHSNINERVLFPGFDGLCDWLQRRYHPIPELIKARLR